MRLGVVLRYVGIIMLVVALFMLLSAGVSLVSHTDSGYYPLLLSALLTALLGAFPLIFVDRTEQLSSKEGYCIVVGSWIVASVVGMFPYLMWGGEFSLVNAWFESVSGYTTTGASILKDVEALPRGLLFWRSCSTWLGGVGVVMFALLILPSLGTNKALLTNVELSSMAKHNYHYKASMIAQILLFIYLGLTFCSTLALKLAGMNWFDALTQAMSAVATSGFSTKNASIGYFDSVAVESILIVTMLLASIHFGVLFATLTGRRNNIFHSEVTRWYLSIVAVVTVVVERMGGRRVCEKCGASYHIINKKSKVEGVCDCCGGKLVTRKDDEPATVLDRLKAYHEQTEPLVAFYKERNKLAVIPFSPSIEATTAEVMKALEA